MKQVNSRQKTFKPKIKKGDEVVIVAGKDKGKQGKVQAVRHEKNGQCRVTVEGANIVKKHVKPNPQMQVQGGIVDKEAPLDISNVMLLNPTTGKGDKVGYKYLEDGQKVRFFRSNGEIVDSTS